MKYTVSILVVLLLVFAGMPALTFSGEDEATPGKSMFLKYKCNSCHTVNAAAIGKTKAEATEDDGWGDEEEEELDPPDLSSVGIKREAEWLHLYMRKKTANEEERKHKKRFKGSKAERAVLVNWLITLKTPVSKPAK
jgi:hypothetical protein